MGNPVINAYPEVFTQFEGENVDHSIRALDWSETFHGMEIIAISTPFSGNSFYKNVIKCLKGKI